MLINPLSIIALLTLALKKGERFASSISPEKDSALYKIRAV